MQKSSIFTIIMLVVAIAGVATSGWLAYVNHVQTGKIEALLQDRNYFLQRTASTTQALADATSTVANLTDQLTSLQSDFDQLESDYHDERSKNLDFQNQIQDIAGTVGTLDKLSKTDKELLQKYSKVYFLNENYVPERLKQIDQSYVLAGKKDQYFHAKAIDFLTNMLGAAADDKIDLKIVSAYRSFEEQTDLKGQYTQVYGSGANTFSADQGYSEHQLGTALDLTTPEIGGTYTSFADTDAYQWLQKNAYKYGFIISYPESNSYYIYEPWHWRFVGVDLAKDLHRDDANFYDWDQRKIDEYLVTIFD